MVIIDFQLLVLFPFRQVHDLDSVTWTCSEEGVLLVAGEDTGLRGRNALYKLGEPLEGLSDSCASMDGVSGGSLDFQGVVVKRLKKAVVEYCWRSG